MSKLDQIYRSILLTRFFTKGWGDPEKLKRIFLFRKTISNRESCNKLVDPSIRIIIDKEYTQKECRILEGHFPSPFREHLPGIMPKEVENAHFQVILPKNWNTKLKPVCVHLAGTGDHFFWRRRTLLAKPLLKEHGIASIILENPYYGLRKPKEQLRSSLLNVSDLFVMGGALVLESLALFHWCERQGWGPLGITGISMGGHMASLAATNWSKPISLVPCLSWSTAASVFTQGVMSQAIPWKLLQDQYFNTPVYSDEISKLICSPEENRKNPAFQLGQNFSKHYPQSMEAIEALTRDISDLSADYPDSRVSNDTPHVQRKSETNVSGKENTKSDSTSKSSDSSTRQNDSTSKQSARQYSTFNQRHSEHQDLRNSQHQSQYSTYNKDSHGRDKTRDSKKKSSKNKNIFGSIYEFMENISLTKDNKLLKTEAVDFMRGVMDECTHLGNFDVPVDPTLAIIIAARADAYYPRDHVLSLQELWPGSELRYIDSGHIAAFLTKQHVFRKAIADSFDRQIEKYYC